VSVPAGSNWIPDWARRSIIYHIYPLGFFDAPPRNTRGDPVPRLADLRRWYDHIVSLGATTIYFGPVFESHSHGYDTIDYFSIDRRLGDNALFREILGELHGRGLRVILDGVFHHTGRDFFAFKDLCQHGRESRYHDWYLVNWGADSFYGDGFAYQCWGGYESLPSLNLDNPEVRKYVFEVARMWLGDVGIDGWRLDVAHEITPNFWWEFRRECKAINPDCFLLGEVLGGDYRVWIAPDLLDSGTDYYLHTAIWRSLNEGNFFRLKATIDRAHHPQWGLFKELTLCNFLGNHDVTRVASRLKDPRHIYPALIVLMNVPGIPCLYYGDEIGLPGLKEDGDEALRRPMLPPDAAWPDEERAIYRVIARLAAIRKQHAALLSGRCATLDVSKTVFSFLRQHKDQTAIVVLNSGPEAASLSISVAREGIADGTTFRDVLNDEDRAYTVRNGALVVDNLWPCWGRILVAGG
jgi:cyclomaltodextrinase